MRLSKQLFGLIIALAIVLGFAAPKVFANTPQITGINIPGNIVIGRSTPWTITYLNPGQFDTLTVYVQVALGVDQIWTDDQMQRFNVGGDPGPGTLTMTETCTHLGELSFRANLTTPDIQSTAELLEGWVNFKFNCINTPVTPSPINPPTPPGEIVGKLVALTGDAGVLLPGQDWQDATVGMNLVAASDFHTGPDSKATIQLTSGDTIVIDQDTQIHVGSFSKENANNLAKLQFLLIMGRIEATIPPQETIPSDFSVTTPTATAGVRGTIFTASYDPQAQVTTFSLQEGLIEVTPTNPSLKPVTLQPGQQVQVTNNSISPVTSTGSPPPSGGTPPPPGGGSMPSGTLLQIAQALDTNHNNKIYDPEMKTADIDWTTSQPVAGTSFTISDDTMKQLFQLWVTGGSIAAAGAAAAGATTLTGLQVRSIEAQTLSDHSVRFVASGQGITGIEAQVYDLSGQLIFDQATNGPTMTFRGLNAEGRPLANGVYLYVLTVKGADGQTAISEVKKLVVLR